MQCCHFSRSTISDSQGFSVRSSVFLFVLF
uniref:Uncharacterized protein n=1 Tax=Anopheles minimus TaxID=112268 RepID=A0A182WMW8_9DIPT